MSVLELAIERTVKDWADEHGVLNAKFTPMGQSGFPDRMFFLPLYPMLIEFKRPGEEPEPLQAYRIRQLRSNGYDVRWTDSKDEAIGWLAEELRKRDSPAASAARLPVARGGVERRARRKR